MASIKIYPNPLVEKLNINFAEFRNEIELHLFDMKGNIIMKKEISQTLFTSLDFIQYNPGTYFLHIILKKEKVSKVYKIQKIK